MLETVLVRHYAHDACNVRRQKAVKKSADTPRAVGDVRTAETPLPAEVEANVSQAVSLTPVKGDGQPSSDEGAPVTGSAGVGVAGGDGIRAPGGPWWQSRLWRTGAEVKAPETEGIRCSSAHP
jgi:hypothetical protein